MDSRDGAGHRVHDDKPVPFNDIDTDDVNGQLMAHTADTVMNAETTKLPESDSHMTICCSERDQNVGNGQLKEYTGRNGHTTGAQSLETEAESADTVWKADTTKVPKSVDVPQGNGFGIAYFACKSVPEEATENFKEQMGTYWTHAIRTIQYIKDIRPNDFTLLMVNDFDKDMLHDFHTKAILHKIPETQVVLITSAKEGCPEHLKKFKNLRVPRVKQSSPESLKDDSWKKLIVELRHHYTLGYYTYLESHYTVHESRARLSLQLKVNITIPEGVISHNSRPDILLTKEKIRDALLDPWSPLREKLYGKWRIKNVEVFLQEKFGPLRVVIVPTSSDQARTIGNACLSGEIAVQIEQTVVLPYRGILWKLKTEFDLEEWGTVCDYLEKKVGNIQEADKDSDEDAGFHQPQCDTVLAKSEDHIPSEPSVNHTIVTKEQRENIHSQDVTAAGQVQPCLSGATAAVASSARQTQKNKVLQQTIIKLAFSLLESDTHSWFKWYNILKKHKESDLDLTKLTTERGETLLHVVVQRQKLDHLRVLFVLGVLAELADIPVPDDCHNSPYAGYTARGIAERFISKKRGMTFMETYDMMLKWERSMSVFARACRAGNTNHVEYLLRKREHELHAEDEYGCTCLYWACCGGNETIVEMLVDRGLDVKHVNKKGETVLHVASKLGHKHLVAQLLGTYKVDPLQVDETQRTAFDYITENGDLEMVKTYKECGVDLPNVMLPVAANHGHGPLVRYLVDECGIKVNFVDDTGKTSIIRAADASQTNLVKYFIEHGANIAVQDRRGRNILHFLAEHGRQECMKIVIDHAKLKGNLQSLINVQDRYIGVELCFMLKGKDNGRRAWHYIEVTRSKVSLFIRISKKGRVDVEKFGTTVVSGWGFTPNASNIGQMESVYEQRKLSGQQPMDSTPLHYAVYHEHEEVVQLLLKGGADPNIQDHFGLTPMHLACMRGNLRLAQLLEDSGAQLDVCDKAKQTPADVADLNEHDAMTNFTTGKQNRVVIDRVRAEAAASLKQLQREDLDKDRRQGKNIKQDVISKLRDLNIAINTALIDLDSGPVTEESSTVTPITPLVPFSSLSESGTFLPAFHTMPNAALSRTAAKRLETRPATQ